MDKNQQRTDVIEINLKEIGDALAQRIVLLVMTGLLFAAAAFAGTKLFIAPEYQSTTKIVVLTKQEDGNLTNSDLQASSLLTKDYAELVRSRTVIENVIAQLQLSENYESVLEKMEVSSLTDTRMLSITVTDEDPYEAARIADTVREEASAHIQQVMDTKAVNVVDTANIPTNPCSPNIKKNTILAGITGVLLAILLISIQVLTDDTIKTAADVEKYLGLSVLESIPLEGDPDVEKKKKFWKISKRVRNNRQKKGI